jgi:ABC-2 type transport system permease protein
MAIFFLLFAVSFTSRSFFVDQEEGMIDRIRAAPVRAGEVVAGKALSAFVFGGVSLAVMVVVTGTAFGADWGQALPAALVAVTMVLAVVALAAVVIALARTQRQAEMLSSIVVFCLAILGGNFVLVSVEPPLMRTLALLTPNGWALRAYTDLATTGGGLGVVTVPLLAILGFTLLVGAVAAVLAPRAVRR